MAGQSGRAEPDIDVAFRGVTKRFGSLTAVDDVNLEVRKGEFLSLLGPSGCGKTTSLRLMAGFEQPDEGEILIGGVNAVGIPPYRRDVNTVFQSYALFPHMSILDNVAYGLKQRGVSKAERYERAREALELVQLTGRDKHRPAMLSGGQQQRVALARALVMNPRVLLLDEPLGALDQKLRKEMQVELKRIQETVGITFVYVTHDQEEALSMSDRVAVMSSGHIEQLDDPRAIYDRPMTPFVAEFIGEMNFFQGEVTAADEGSFRVDTGSGIVVRGRGSAPVGERITLGIRSERMIAAGDRAAQEACAASGFNCAPAEVLTKMYLGDQIQIVARLIDGSNVVVREQRADADPALDNVQPGDGITVSWDDTAPHVMSAAQTAAGQKEEP
jgi:spermidine/putrescine transport system ATP-binding protein